MDEVPYRSIKLYIYKSLNNLYAVEDSMYFVCDVSSLFGFIHLEVIYLIHVPHLTDWYNISGCSTSKHF
jgi:hypothetical protein